MAKYTIKDKWICIFEKALRDLTAKDFECCSQCISVNMIFMKNDVEEMLSLLRGDNNG